MIIDIHAHIYPDKIAAVTVDSMSAGAGLNPACDGTKAGIIAHMQASGVDLSVILPVATNPLKVNRLNDFALDINGKNGLMSFGAIHPDCEYWYDELARIKDCGLKGVKIHPVFQNADFDDKRYLRIFERCAELDLIVISHTGRDVGFPAEYRCTPSQIKNAVKLTGGFKLICAHMGGWEMWDEALELLPETGVYIDTAFALGTYKYRNNPERHRDIEEAFGEQGSFVQSEQFMEFMKAFGSERILYGSDSPWESQLNGIDFINSLPLDEKTKSGILGQNAARLLGI